MENHKYLRETRPRGSLEVNMFVDSRKSWC